MTDPVRRAFSQDALITAATAYMSEYFGPIPKDEPERTSWYEHYGMLINFTGWLWAYDMRLGLQHRAPHAE